MVDEADDPSEDPWADSGTRSLDELRRDANVALALAVAGLLFCGIVSVVALILTRRARAEAQASGQTWSDGTITAANFVSMLGIVTWVVYALWWMFG